MPNHFHLALYIERNPLRAKLVSNVQDWRWSSASAIVAGQPLLDPGPVPRPSDWLALVNQPQTEAEVERLRESLRRNRPFGHPPWVVDAAQRLGLEASLNPLGRPRKTTVHKDPGPKQELF
jgi:hypothetical protein